MIPEREELVSVIVPIYNSEKYLAGCLDSIIAQTHRNLEIICVNDGSTDRSGEILADYAARDVRIRIVGQENGGLSAARNAGIERATGTYVYFIDADDFISDDTIAGLCEVALRGRYPVTVNERIVMLYPDGRQRPLVRNPHAGEMVIGGQPDIARPACHKLYDRQRVFGELGKRFPEGVLHEDIYFFYTLFPHLERIGFAARGTYYYRQHEESIMGRVALGGAGTLQVLEMFCLVHDYYRERKWLGRYALPFSALSHNLRHCENAELLCRAIRRCLTVRRIPAKEYRNNGVLRRVMAAPGCNWYLLLHGRRRGRGRMDFAGELERCERRREYLRSRGAADFRSWAMLYAEQLHIIGLALESLTPPEFREQEERFNQVIGRMEPDIFRSVPEVDFAEKDFNLCRTPERLRREYGKRRTWRHRLRRILMKGVSR